MSKLTVLIGIPASGKSTYSKKMEDTVIISSDELRIEMLGDVEDQSQNDEVFKELYNRVEINLKDGRNVCIDSTNISSKKRREIVNKFKGKADELVAIYFDLPYELCLERNETRDRTVPKKVMDRFYRTLQVPTYSEKWDKIEVISHYRDVLPKLYTREALEDIISKYPDMTHYELLGFHLYKSEIFRKIYNLAQDNSFHSFSVSRHTYYVWKDIVDNYNEEDKLVMLWATLLHDTGKHFCKEFQDGKRYASFIGHENVSAQLACNLLLSLGYDLNFVLDVVEIIQNHMKLLSIGDSEKGKKKLLDFVGQEVYNKLIRFKEADTNAK